MDAYRREDSLPLYPFNYSTQYAAQSRWAHLSGRQRPMYPLPLVYKRGATARRKLRLEKRPRPAEDRFIHTTKNNTSPSGRRVLRSGGPNHSKSCVLESLSQRRFSPIA